MTETFQIKFTSIDLVSKSLELPNTTQNSEIDFNFLVDLKVSPELKIAVVITDVTLSRDSGRSRLAFFKLICVFEFPEFDLVFPKLDDGKFEIPINIEILLKSTGLSTVRGVIYSELRGTYLQNAILPLIDISSIVLQGRDKKEAVNS
jgi:hypothetical protein